MPSPPLRKPYIDPAWISKIKRSIEVDQKLLFNMTRLNSLDCNLGTDEKTELIILDCETRNTSVKSLVDTGASSNYLSGKMFIRLQQSAPSSNLDIKPYNGLIKIADQTLVRSLGVVTLDMFILDRIVAVSFVIIKKLSYDAILGMEFLTENNVIISLSSPSNPEPSCIYFKNPPYDPLGIVRTSESSPIPPFSRKIVTVRIPNTYNSVQVLRNLKSFNNQFGVYVGQGPVNCDKLSFSIFINNLTNKEQTIPIHTQIGRLNPLKDYNIPLITDQLCFLDENFENENTETPKSFLTPKENIKLSDLNFNIEGLNVDQSLKVTNLLESNLDLFASQNPGATSLVTHTVETGDSLPINVRPYRTSPSEKIIIDTEVDKMIKNNVISPSRSPWASPVVLVTKKDGTTRFCIDYRKLNLVTTKDVYPLPRIDDSLSVLSGGQWFTTLDFTTGYCQIPMDIKSKLKTAFITHGGLYEFNVMPFGLTNAPATFQRFMDIVLAGLK